MELEEIVSLCEALRGASLRGWTQEKLDGRLLQLMAEYKPYIAELSRGWFSCTRGVVADSYGHVNVSRCIHPPAEKVGWGRANLPHQPVYYASRNVATVMGELRLEPSQHVQTITSNQTTDEPLKCAVIGELEYAAQSFGGSLLGSWQFHTGSSAWDRLADRSMKSLWKELFLDAFFADLFSRRIDRSYEHKLTALFAHHYFSNGMAVAYPSVEVRGGLNVALSASMFDKRFQVFCAELLRVNRYLGYGVYDYSIVKVAHEFAADGSIIWKDPADVKVTRTPFGDVVTPNTPWRPPTAAT